MKNQYKILQEKYQFIFENDNIETETEKDFQRIVSCKTFVEFMEVMTSTSKKRGKIDFGKLLTKIIDFDKNLNLTSDAGLSFLALAVATYFAHAGRSKQIQTLWNDWYNKYSAYKEIHKDNPGVNIDI